MIDREALIQKLRDLFYSYQDSSDGDALEEAIEILSAPALASQEGAQAGEVVTWATVTEFRNLIDKRISRNGVDPAAIGELNYLKMAAGNLFARRATTPPAPDEAVQFEPDWEAVAFNLCSEFGAEFVEDKHDFAKAVVREYLRSLRRAASVKGGAS